MKQFRKLQKIMAIAVIFTMTLSLVPTSALAAGVKAATSLTAGNTIYYGTYWQNYSGTGDEKCQSSYIKASVAYYLLGVASDKLSLQAENVLFYKNFSNGTADTGDPTFWSQSALKDYLNNSEAGSGFAGDAFNTQEYNALNDVTLTDAKGSYTGKIYLPSLYDSYYNASSATAYALNTSPNNGTDKENNNNRFWFRSNAKSSGTYYAWVETFTGANQGKLDYWGVAKWQQMGILPSFQINPQKVLFASAAESGKSAATVGTGFKAGETGTDYVLTLKESSVASDAATGIDKVSVAAAYNSVLTLDASSASTLTNFYSDANFGSAYTNNKYVSALISTDSSNITGTAESYAKLADASAASGNLTIGSGGTSTLNGDYTMSFFAEQANGDKQTDYAGDLADNKISVHFTDGTMDGMTLNSSVGSVYDSITLKNGFDLTLEDDTEITNNLTIADTGSTLSLQNTDTPSISALEVGTLELKADSTLSLDVQIANKEADMDSDKITADILSGTGKMTLGGVNILGYSDSEDAWAFGATRTVNVIDQAVTITNDQQFITATSGGRMYTFTGSNEANGSITATKSKYEGGIGDIVQNHTLSGYELGNINDYVMIEGESLNLDSGLGTLTNVSGKTTRSFTITGNGYTLDANGKAGITVNSGYKFTVKNATLSGFGTFATNAGTMTLNGAAFTGSTGTTNITNSGTLTLEKTASTFDKGIENTGTLNVKIASSNLGSITGTTSSGTTNIKADATVSALTQKTVIISSGKTLTSNGELSANTVTNSGTLNIAAENLKATVTGANSSANVNLGAGTLADSSKLEGSGTITTTGDITANAESLAATAGVANEYELTLNGGALGTSISGTDGTLKISGAVTNTANNSIAQKNLTIGENNSLGSGSGNVAISGNLENNGTFTTTGTVAIGGNISGSGTTTINTSATTGAGTLAITGAESKFEAGTINGTGTLSIYSGAALNVTGGTLSLSVDNGGTLTIAANHLTSTVTGNSDSANVNLTGGTETATELATSAILKGSGTITTTGKVLANASSLQATGGIVNNGTLAFTGGELTTKVTGSGTTEFNSGTTTVSVELSNSSVAESAGLNINASNLKGASNAVEGTLTLAGGTLANGSAITGAGKIEASDNVTVENAANLAVTSTEGIKNEHTLTLNSGNLGANITDADAATGTTKIAGAVTNTDNKTIKQKELTIETTGNFSTNASNLASGIATITNNGTLTLTGGTLDSDIAGDGTTAFTTDTTTVNVAVKNTSVATDGGLTIAAANLQGASNEVNGTLTLNEGDLAAASIISGTGKVITGGDITANASSFKNTGGIINDHILTLTGGTIGVNILNTDNDAPGTTLMQNNAITVAEGVTINNKIKYDSTSTEKVEVKVNENATIGGTIEVTDNNGEIVISGTGVKNTAEQNLPVTIEDAKSLDTTAKGAVLKGKVTIGENATLTATPENLTSEIINGSKHSVDFVDGAYESTGKSTFTGTIKNNGDNVGWTKVKSGELINQGTIENDIVLYSGTSFTNSGTLRDNATMYFRGLTDDTNTTAIKVSGDISKVSTMYFNLEGVNSGSTIVNAADTIDMSAKTVGLIKTTKPTDGDEVTLIDKASGYAATTVTARALNEEGLPEVVTKYDYKTYIENGALVAEYASRAATDESKSFSEGRIGGIAAITAASDLLAGSAMESAVSAAQKSNGGAAAFAEISGSHGRYNTGSYVDLNSTQVVAGLAKKINAKATVGAYIEGGNGRYTANNQFDTGELRADGDINYFGAGIFGKYNFKTTDKGNYYVDAAFGAGHTNQDYATESTALSAARYDSGMAYLKAHATVGYEMNVANGKLNSYLKYLYARQNADTVTLSTGETIDFNAINSHRLRAGARYTQKINNSTSWYGGLAYEYEFNGKASAQSDGTALLEPELKGGSGMAELGFNYTPKKSDGWNINLGVQGFTGKRDSIGVKLGATYSFPQAGTKTETKKAEPAKKTEKPTAAKKAEKPAVKNKKLDGIINKIKGTYPNTPSRKPAAKPAYGTSATEIQQYKAPVLIEPAK